MENPTPFGPRLPRWVRQTLTPGIDTSFAARKGLATELGCPADAKMNIWLHKTVLAFIAANGGNVPKDLLY